MINPLKAARVDSQQSQSSVAASTALSPQSVLRAEQGLFSSPPKALLEYLEVPAQAYYEWVFETRNLHKDFRITELAKQRHALLGPISTDRLRYDCFQLSVAGFAKHLVVQISIVQEFLNRNRNTDTIGNILMQWGMDIDKLTDLRSWVNAA